VKVALAQIAPVLLDREATLVKVESRIREASVEGAALVAFGEALVPGYPAWLSRSDAARFDAADQKTMHARYLDQAVCLEEGHLDGVRAAAAESRIAVALGVVERPADRGGHSLYCSLVWIGEDGEVRSVHRKLVPTYEERLAWSTGDGAGLVVHRCGEFTVGALNCWENWMPLSRAALHAQGEDLHVAIWPGSARNTLDITRFLAMEGRSYVVSVSGLLRESDLPDDLPNGERMARPDEILHDGGSAVAGPDGGWLLEPVVGEETLLVVDLDHRRVLEERQNFDPSGHYARPDVLRLEVDRRRQSVARWID
jgi:nitrilase